MVTVDTGRLGPAESLHRFQECWDVPQNTGMGHGNIGTCSRNIPGPQECWDVPVTPWNGPQEHWNGAQELWDVLQEYRDGAQEHLWDSGMLGWALERSGRVAEMLGCTTGSSLAMSGSLSPGPWKGLHQGKPGTHGMLWAGKAAPRQPPS